MIILSSRQTAIIYAHARNKYPDECCGILLGKRNGEYRIVKEVCKVNNSAEREMKKKRFVISTEQILYAEYIAARKDYEIIGIYHSHTDCGAIASQEDSNFAIPGISYPIVSVKGGEIQELLSWEKIFIEEKEIFIKEEIEIENQRNNRWV